MSVSFFQSLVYANLMIEKGQKDAIIQKTAKLTG
jgi:hypothetical protein